MSGIKIMSGLEPGYHNRDLGILFETMQGAIDRLDVLGQLQSAVGGLSMSARASETFECHAQLDDFLKKLRVGVVSGLKNEQEYKIEITRLNTKLRIANCLIQDLRNQFSRFSRDLEVGDRFIEDEVDAIDCIRDLLEEGPTDD